MTSHSQTSKNPYEDPELSPQERARDLTTRLSVSEKVGLMFQTVIETGSGGNSFGASWKH